MTLISSPFSESYPGFVCLATKEEATEAYNIVRGLSAVTNIEMNHYDVEAMMNGCFPDKLSLDSPSPSSSDHNLYFLQQHVVPPSDINAKSLVLYHHYPLASTSTDQAEFILWPNESYWNHMTHKLTRRPFIAI